MNENEKFALVPRPSSAVEKAEAGARRVLSGMVADALTLAKKEQSALTAARFRIGDNEWREPDYQQILIWAKALALEPQEVIRRLLIINEQLNNELKEGGEAIAQEPIFANGAILKLYWDFELLPLKTFEWVAGLMVEELFFVSTPEKPPNFALYLPHLRHLACHWVDLAELDLSGVPRLTSLCCDVNSLTKLDLSKVPMLTTLDCSYNPLAELNLSGVPKLTKLYCMTDSTFGRLTKLDLSNVPMLEELSCHGNQIHELDVSGLFMLTSLACGDNQLTELDLSGVPMLTELFCFGNRLVELDLSSVPNLRKLNCSLNRLVELDIRSLPNLQELSYTHYREKVSTRLIQRSDQNF